MKATELNLEPKGYNFSCNAYPARSHYKFVMRLGRCFPTTKSQTKYFNDNRIVLDVLNYEDVQTVELLLKKHGFEGDYKPTKSGRWARLQNHDDLYAAIKSEYNA